MIFFLILFSSLQARPFVDCGRLVIDVEDVQTIHWGLSFGMKSYGAWVNIWTKDGESKLHYVTSKKIAKKCVKDFKEKASEKIPIARKLGYLF